MSSHNKVTYVTKEILRMSRSRIEHSNVIKVRSTQESQNAPTHGTMIDYNFKKNVLVFVNFWWYLFCEIVVWMEKWWIFKVPWNNEEFEWKNDGMNLKFEWKNDRMNLSFWQNMFLWIFYDILQWETMNLAKKVWKNSRKFHSDLGIFFQKFKGKSRISRVFTSK